MSDLEVKEFVKRFVDVSSLTGEEYKLLLDYVSNAFENKASGTYRYLIYEVLGWGWSGYGRGMDIGLLEMNNALYEVVQNGN